MLDSRLTSRVCVCVWPFLGWVTRVESLRLCRTRGGASVEKRCSMWYRNWYRNSQPVQLEGGGLVQSRSGGEVVARVVVWFGGDWGRWGGGRDVVHMRSKT